MMQQRFCLCGQPVLVRYSNRFGSWNTQFLVGQGRVKGEKTSANACPNCGAALNINRLR
jgi:hypothetical protein